MKTNQAQFLPFPCKTIFAAAIVVIEVSGLACGAGAQTETPDVSSIPATSVTQPEAPSARGATTQELLSAEMERDTTLSAKVSLEAKRRPLDEILAEVSKQSGVTLLANNKAPIKALVTMRIHEMPLSALMLALSRIYGVRWTKSAISQYLMNATIDTPLQAKLRRMGHLYWFRFDDTLTFSRSQRQQELNALANEVVANSNRAALLSPQGAAVANLPAELQRKLRAVYEEDRAGLLVRGYHRAFWQTLSPSSRVKITLPPLPPEVAEPTDTSKYEPPEPLPSSLEVTSTDGNESLLSIPLLPASSKK